MAILKDKTILVTGAGSGIGRAVALKAAQSGARLILISKQLKKLESIYDEILNGSYKQGICPQPILQPVNLLTITPRDAQIMAEQVQEQFGMLHGLVHCAGIVGQLSPIEHYPAHLWQEVLHLNLTIPFLLTQAFLPLLKSAPASVILFSAAEEGIYAKPYFGAYACSKFGIEALKNMLLQELENTPSVQVKSVRPSKVRTALRAKIYPAEDPNTLRHPTEVAKDYLACLSSIAKCLGSNPLVSDIDQIEF